MSDRKSVGGGRSNKIEPVYIMHNIQIFGNSQAHVSRKVHEPNCKPRTKPHELETAMEPHKPRTEPNRNLNDLHEARAGWTGVSEPQHESVKHVVFLLRGYTQGQF